MHQPLWLHVASEHFMHLLRQAWAGFSNHLAHASSLISCSTGTSFLAAGTSSQEPPSLHVAAWHEQAPSPADPSVTWQRSTEMLTRILAADPDRRLAQDNPPNAAAPAQGSWEPQAIGSSAGDVRMNLSLDGSTCAVAWRGPGLEPGSPVVSHTCLLATDSMQASFCTMTFGSTAKVLAKCMLKYYKIL